MIFTVVFENGESTTIWIGENDSPMVSAKEIVGHRGAIASVKFQGFAE